MFETTFRHYHSCYVLGAQILHDDIMFIGKIGKVYACMDENCKPKNHQTLLRYWVYHSIYSVNIYVYIYTVYTNGVYAQHKHTARTS